MKKIAFQGHLGAYSHLACHHLFPDAEMVTCLNFDTVFEVVESGQADVGVIPVENSTAGRVADIHRLMPRTNLKITGEYFQPIHHCLLGVKGATKEKVTTCHSHIQALTQCEHYLKGRGIAPHEYADTAGAAEYISELRDPSHAAIASSIAAEIYGLDILEKDIQDTDHNTTRFLVIEPQERIPDKSDKTITTFLFRVRNIPAALYKALGGFATNGINMLKLESYITDGSFQAAQFYVDIEGHPSDEAVNLAMEELRFFSEWVQVLGSYPMNRGNL